MGLIFEKCAGQICSRLQGKKKRPVRGNPKWQIMEQKLKRINDQIPSL